MGYIIFVRTNTLWGYRRRILISSGRTLTGRCRNDGTAGGEKACSSSPFCVKEEGLKMAKEEMMAKEEKFCCAATANSDAGKTMSGSSCCDCVKHKHRDVNSKEYKRRGPLLYRHSHSGQRDSECTECFQQRIVSPAYPRLCGG